MPERGQLFGPSLPDLARIDPDQWREVLIPLDGRARIDAATCPGLSGARTLEALELALSLPQAPSRAAQAGLDGAPRIPVPAAKGSPNAGRQLNVRMPHAAYADLQRAATVLGATPSQVARMLVLNGVRRVLAEHDVALDRARRERPPAP